MKNKTRTYKPLKKQVFTIGKYKILPIRNRDKYDIMKWRNEQMYHLRQNERLTPEKQDKYFEKVLDKLFEENQPKQILFSYLKNDKCIGYGGLVHIDWTKKTAELSFIMDTLLEKKEFEKHWLNFIHLIDTVAFSELQFKNIFTYAYDLRPHLYPVLEKAGFEQEKILRDTIRINDQPVNVIIHKKNSPEIIFEDAGEDDLKLLYDWVNDDLVRQQSFHSEKISLEEHQKWFRNKLKNPKAILWIAKIENKPTGLVRFDIKNKQATIGISIDKKYRGKGYGSKILSRATEEFIRLFKLPVFAYIKPDNSASQRAFEKAGYVYKKNETINGINSLLYKKTI